MKIPRSRYILFLLAVAFFLALDLGSKYLVFQRCGLPNEKPTYWVIQNVFGFQTCLNEGALFGMGKGYALVFAGFSVVAFIITWAWLFWGKAAQSKLWTFTLGMMNGGVLGNLYDRLGLHGLKWDWLFIPFVNMQPIHQPGEPVYAVRDWIVVMLGSFQWPNFNIADSCLVVGVCVLALEIFLCPQTKKETK